MADIVMQHLEEQVGARVKKLRIARGLSQSQVAKLMLERGFSWRQTTVAKTEAAERPIRINEADALARALGLEFWDLFGPDGEDEQESLRGLLDAETRVAVARQRVQEVESGLAEERQRLRDAEDDLERAGRRFHEVRGIDHDELRNG